MLLRRKVSADDSYLKLIQDVHPLRPLHTDDEHQHALRALRSLANDRRPVAIDYKKVLLSLVTTYEAEAGHRLQTAGHSPADIIRHLLTERSMSVAGLAKVTKLPQSSLSEMLAGRREWSKTTIVTLSRFFALSPALFLK